MADLPAPQAPVDNADDTPPLLGSWRNIYAAVLLYLVLLIVLFYAFRKAFEA